MTRISRTSSLKSNRYQLQYVNDLNNPEAVSRVDPLQKVKPVENHTAHPSEHHLAFYENYYQSVEELKREFKAFYHDERALRAATNEFYQSNDPTQISEKLQQLLSLYNKTLDSLQSFDTAINTSHSAKVHLAFQNHADLLHSFGISTDENRHLQLDKELLHNKLLADTENTDVLFLPLKQVIIDMYKVLHGIRVPKRATSSNYDSSPLDYRGLLIEGKYIIFPFLLNDVIISLIS